MLRNLVAVILATVIGLTVAKFIEGLIGGGVAAGAREFGGLVAGYFAGAFIAAAIALLIGRRWVPLGWLGAATILFASVITLATFSLPLLLWPLSAAACGAGGWLAVTLLKAEMQYRQGKQDETLFD